MKTAASPPLHFSGIPDLSTGGPMRSVGFEIVGGPETGDKGGIYFKSQWLNPLGGGMRTPMASYIAFA